MMAMEIGDEVPDLSSMRPNGTPVRLSEFTAPAVVLIFLRHLA